MKKEEALITKISAALKVVLAASGSTLPMPSGVDVLSKELGKALTETYDSKEDPAVLAAMAITPGSDIPNGQINIGPGGTFTFNHGLGFIPHVTVIRNAGSNYWGIIALTDQIVTIFHDHPSNNNGSYRVICS